MNRQSRVNNDVKSNSSVPDILLLPLKSASSLRLTIGPARYPPDAQRHSTQGRHKPQDCALQTPYLHLLNKELFFPTQVLFSPPQSNARRKLCHAKLCRFLSVVKKKVTLVVHAHLRRLSLAVARGLHRVSFTFPCFSLRA